MTKKKPGYLGDLENIYLINCQTVVVTRDVAQGCIVAGVPARVVGHVDENCSETLCRDTY